ncbi:MAG: hypothetical protein ACREFJ_11280 [Acetobacteraceae bacterium]
MQRTPISWRGNTDHLPKEIRLARSRQKFTQAHAPFGHSRVLGLALRLPAVALRTGHERGLIECGIGGDALA